VTVVNTKAGRANTTSTEEDKSMSSNEYYALLKEAYERTDWTDRNSIHAYNEYARKLRNQVEKEEK